jgi:hypothetical protein
MSIYIKENLITLENKLYERLFNHPENFKYREISGDNDYDYVEDERLISALDQIWYNISF